MDINKILVIVPAINLWERYTKPCIDSVLASKIDVPFEILLVDNASTDGTSEKYKEYFEKKSIVGHLMRNEQNLGCAGGWNAGIKYGLMHGFTHFWIINNDILVSPKTMQALYKRITDESKVLVSAIDITGEVVSPEQVLDESHPVNNKESSEAPHPHFSCFMINKQTLEKVGYFDEAFFPAYFEDNSYHYRCKLLAGDNSAVTTTDGAFYHYGSRTQNEAFGGVPVVPGDSFNANRQRFIQLWGGMPGQEQFKHPANNQTLSAKLNVNQQYEPLTQ